MPRATLEVVSDSGHATPVDQPAEFNRLVLAFLRRVDAESTHPGSDQVLGLSVPGH